MIFKPQHILSFGVNKGKTLEEIYLYMPSYIEWLIKYIPDFEIFPSDFKSLPKPLVHTNIKIIRAKDGTKVSLHLNHNHEGSVDEIKESNHLQESNFSFSKETLRILSEKSEAIYVVPKYQKTTAIASKKFKK